MSQTLRAVPMWSAAMMLASGVAHASELMVDVTGIREGKGQIACALFQSQEGFPMSTSGARIDTRPATTPRVECRFTDVAPGIYAIAVVHDENMNGVTDTNFLGAPTEGWAVSNNVRTTLRAPRFDEAKIEISARPQRLSLNLAY